MFFIRSGEAKASCLIPSPTLTVPNRCMHRSASPAATSRQSGYNIRICLNCPMSTEEIKTEAGAELERLNNVLEVAKRNGNQTFIENIQREIAAIKRGENSPLIAEYLTDEERSGSRPGR